MLNKLTQKFINAYPIVYTSSDVREGVCELGDCHKAVPGLYYSPGTVLEAIFCNNSYLICQHLTCWQKNGPHAGDLESLWHKKFPVSWETVLQTPSLVQEIEEFLAKNWEISVRKEKEILQKYGYL